MHTQLAVLGGGPGGYAAAFLAADEGLEVTLVESDARLGGTCLLRGCIPSKALLHVARVIAEVEELKSDWGVQYGEARIDIAQVRARKEKVIATLSGGLHQLAKRRKVRVIRARGVLENATSLRLEGDPAALPDGGQLSFDHLILATGSVPFLPANLNLDSPRVMDSTGGAGLAGAAAVAAGHRRRLHWAGDGHRLCPARARVSVVELTDGLLPGADRDLVKPLQKQLQTLFEGRIYLNTKVGSLGIRDSLVEVAFEGPGKYGVERFDRVLVSVGCKPNTAQLGLENTRIETDRRGFVVCDQQQRTAEPNIFAVGDIAGEPMLAHKATHEAKTAVEAALGRPVAFDKRAIPAVVFTDPEIAWAGLTEVEAKRDGRPFELAVYPWGASGRAQAIGRTDGFTKWLIDPESQRVLGCGIVGPGAGELIAEAVLAIEMGCEVHDLTDSVHPHPTLSETLMNAGEVFFGTATEIYKPKRSTGAAEK